MRSIPQRPTVELWKPATRALAAAGAVTISVFAWGWWADYEQRALMSLPAAERVRIYDRNLESMRVLCGQLHSPDAFEARCREQALFLAEFPECGAGCHALIAPFLPRPSR